MIIEKLDEFRETSARNGGGNREPSLISVSGRCRD